MITHPFEMRVFNKRVIFLYGNKRLNVFLFNKKMSKAIDTTQELDPSKDLDDNLDIFKKLLQDITNCDEKVIREI